MPSQFAGWPHNKLDWTLPADKDLTECLCYGVDLLLYIKSMYTASRRCIGTTVMWQSQPECGDRVRRPVCMRGTALSALECAPDVPCVGGCRAQGRWQGREKPALKAMHCSGYPLASWFDTQHAPVIWKTSFLLCTILNYACYPYLLQMLQFLSSCCSHHYHFNSAFIFIGNSSLFFTECQEDLNLKQVFAIQPTVSSKT